MIIVPITPVTVELIAGMNEGVEPEVEFEETFFVYFDQETPARIVTDTELQTLKGLEDTKPYGIVIFK